MNVAPAGAQSALKLVSAEAAAEKDKRGVAVTLENPSSMYAYFSDAKLNLQSGGWRKALSGGELRQLIGYGVILPGKKRRIFVPADVPEGVGAITANIEYKSKTTK